jgi:predicted ATP-dependent endonuclease of OLD family
MKIKTVKIENFRSYKDEVKIEFGNLTAFVGKNDIGKSTVLEALDIFFNCGSGLIKLDKDDINKQALSEGNTETIISVCFEELPTSIIIDSTNRTTLQAEYMLNTEGQFEVVKKYSSGGKEKVFVRAYHPTGNECNDLLLKRNTDLQKIIRENSIPCSNQTLNAVMRAAIWQHFSSQLQLKNIEIDITKGDTKSIWDKLQSYLPLYSLFQSDRKNSDGDSEVQDPLKEAVKQLLYDEFLKAKFNEIASEVKIKLQDVATRTLAKIQEMNPDIASSLNPIIPPVESLRWTDVFKSVSIAGDEDIPINKRGSGVKRLILLNFFRAEAERRKIADSIPSIVYAIEEPETSQHTEHQKKLIKAFLDLSNAQNTQVILTTHSAALVKELRFKHLRLVKTENNTKTVQNILPNRLPYPSLNEVNYLAFSEITEEYHNELYGYIEMENEMSNYRNAKPRMNYIELRKDGTTVPRNIILTDYVRHQIHHPENTLNARFTFQQLSDSINLMRDFIETLTS